MNKQRKNISRQAAALALCALAASAAPSASAQEAGRLVVFSHLSEPLNASAPLALSSALQASDVTARVASEALYAAAGARRPAWADQARIEARAVGKNRVELRVSTPSPVEDPASTLILEIDVKGEGSSTKQYAVILDPLEMGKPVAKADASDGSAGLQARAQAEAKAPPARAESDRLVVKSGQILYGIAQAKRPSDVSVQRMMVGMLRANPQAFVQGNVNRLKAGAVMRMPTNDELAGIGQAEAAQAINRQAADFAKWRSLAAKPAEVAAPKTAPGEGQVDKVAAAPEAGPDVLRLGKAQAGKRDATDEIAQKSREAEAKARIDELDRMRDDVKKAMTIAGGGELAALEAKAAAGQEPKAQDKPQDSAPVEAPAADQAEGAPEQAQPEAPKPEAPKPEAPKTAPPPAPPAEPEPEPSFMESAIAALSENRLFAAGGLAALLAAAALAARKRKAKKGFSGPTTIVPDAAGAHPPAAAASQEPEVSEFQTHLNSADTYLAFNKLDRAGEEIRQALEIEPKNLDGLIMGARVAARSQDRESLARFVAQIGDLTFKAGPYWDEADGLLAQASRGEPQEEAPVAPPVDFSADLERSLMDLASAAPARPQAEPSSKLDFEVPSFDLPPAPATSSDPYAGVDFPSPAPADPRSESLSFDLSLPDDPPSAPSQPSQTLNFEPASAEPQEAAAESEVEGELRTMLDLARAYVDMGDKDGARELLTEIEQKGSPGLSAKAKELLDTL